MRTHFRLTIIGLVVMSFSNSIMTWEYDKNEKHPRGAKAVSQLKKDGDYYIVNGADLHSLGADLIGKKIRFHGYAWEIKRFPTSTLLLLSEDKCFFVILYRPLIKCIF